MLRNNKPIINQTDEDNQSNDFSLQQRNNNWKSDSNPCDGIREEFRLDQIQAFSDEHYWNLESDQLLETELVSDDYLDFLVGFE
ncbi:MAG: hypothetical protein AAGF26_10780 [Cyanobacteria bacterium P01_G01_bin.49]